MTRDELINKRKQKKTLQAISAIALAAAIVSSAVGIYSGVIPLGRTLDAIRIQPEPEAGPEEAESFIIPAIPEEEPEVTEAAAPEEQSYTGPTGWQEDEKGRYYLDAQGEKQTGWLHTDDGSVYLLNKKGYMLKGWQDPDIGRVYLGEDGRLTTGLAEIDGDHYYFGYDGVNLSGWQDVGEKTYYFSSEDGKALTGWQVINDTDCYFDETGAYIPDKEKPRTIDGPVIALTFDDGPGVYTNEILNILEENNAKATFFMLGMQIYDFPDAVKREHDIGMEQGNHSWDHKTLTHLTDEEIYNEVERTNQVIQEVTGSRPTLFRPPGGGYNDSVFANCTDLPMILWTIDTLDWKTKDAQATYDCVMQQAGDGAVILMHEIYQASVEAARRFIPALISQGYTFVTISEMAAIKGVQLTTWTKYGQF